jgi:hypothetical protein
VTHQRPREGEDVYAFHARIQEEERERLTKWRKKKAAEAARRRKAALPHFVKRNPWKQE